VTRQMLGNAEWAALKDKGSMRTCGGDYAAVAIPSSSFVGRKPE
jgi:hypothetical protein